MKKINTHTALNFGVGNYESVARCAIIAQYFNTDREGA